MIKTEFHQPTGKVIENIDLSEMRRYVIDVFEDYWTKGSGDGYIDCFINGVCCYSLIIGPNIRYGIYLHYIDNITGEHWLSLNDKGALNEVAEIADEIYVSIGLFLPINEAWNGIKEFLSTGKRSSSINWVKPNIIPENGNW